jgi:hypothetical protein
MRDNLDSLCGWGNCLKPNAAGVPLCGDHLMKAWATVQVSIEAGDGRCLIAACNSAADACSRFQLCPVHAIAVANEVNSQRDEWLGGITENQRSFVPEAAVYYLHLKHGDIKIGQSINLLQRMQGLRSSLADVLAVEPGGFDVEQLRHRQFAAHRRGRVEDFADALELRNHIAAMRLAHGDPTDYADALNRRNRDALANG